MAKYKRRPKVKRYRRSFYSRGMRIRKIVGIVVLVAVVLAAAWFAAPHVLDWATHTWYTVVKDRDLEAESASRAAASSQAAASAAASEAASSAASEPEEDVFDGKAIVSGRWAELDTAALTDDDTLRTTAQQLKAQGVEYAVLTLKDAAGNIYYASQAAASWPTRWTPGTSRPSCGKKSSFRWRSWRPSRTPSRPAPTPPWPSTTTAAPCGWMPRRTATPG